MIGGFSRHQSSRYNVNSTDMEVDWVMEGSIWLFLALIVALVALGAALAMRCWKTLELG